jgi:predicted DNA-binding transcriptional regulator AlpA
VTGRKKQQRAFPPDYVSAQTLAYRLDCSRSTVDDYVRRGLLPKPISVGTLQRWRWSDIEIWIVHTSVRFRSQESVSHNAGPDEEDPYCLGVKRVTPQNA